MSRPSIKSSAMYQRPYFALDGDPDFTFGWGYSFVTIQISEEYVDTGDGGKPERRIKVETDDLGSMICRSLVRGGKALAAKLNSCNLKRSKTGEHHKGWRARLMPWRRSKTAGNSREKDMSKTTSTSPDQSNTTTNITDHVYPPWAPQNLAADTRTIDVRRRRRLSEIQQQAEEVEEDMEPLLGHRHQHHRTTDTISTTVNSNSNDTTKTTPAPKYNSNKSHKKRQQPRESWWLDYQNQDQDQDKDKAENEDNNIDDDGDEATMLYDGAESSGSGPGRRWSCPLGPEYFQVIC
jgi:hypothetical protein